MNAPEAKTASTRRLWLVAAASTVVAIGLAAVAIFDLRRAPITQAAPANQGAGVASAPLASSPRAEPQAPRDDARMLERARRKALGNAEVRGDARQSTPLMNAWSEAFAGKRGASAPPVAVARPAFDRAAPGSAAPSDAPRVGPRLQQLAERVNLTPEQIDTLAVALRDEREQISALRQQRQDGTLTYVQARAQIDAIRDQTDAQLQHVLNAEQQAAVSELRERRAASRHDGTPRSEGAR